MKDSQQTTSIRKEDLENQQIIQGYYYGRTFFPNHRVAINYKIVDGAIVITKVHVHEH